MQDVNLRMASCWMSCTGQRVSIIFKLKSLSAHPTYRKYDRQKHRKMRQKWGAFAFAQRARIRALSLRPDWEQVKDDVMRLAVLKKFQTHADIQEILLSTSDELLVENSPIDYYWGCGKDGTGKNRLGQIVMEVREILRNSKPQ